MPKGSSARLPLVLAACLGLAGCISQGRAPGVTPASGPASQSALCSEDVTASLFRPTIQPSATIAATGLIQSASGGTLLIQDSEGATRVVDLATGRQTFRLAPDAAAPTRALVLGDQRAIDQAAGWRRSLDLRGDASARILGNGRVRVTTSRGNGLDIVLTRDGWAVLGEGGRFDGSPSILRGFVATDGPLSLPLSHLADPYFEPGLLGYALHNVGEMVTKDTPRLADGIPAPPTVALSIDDDGTTATVRAEDRGGCIGRVTLFHNGKALAAEAAIADKRTFENGRAIHTVQYPIPEGGGRLEAVATSSLKVEGGRATAALPRPAKTAAQPVLHVLAIGINQYADPALTLTYAVADAMGLAERLSDNHSGRLFTTVKARVITDREATADGILSAIGRLGETAIDDVVVIYLAGHGENDGEVWYFLPTEFGREISLAAIAREDISSRTIKDALGRIKAQRLVLLVDACKSGELGTRFAAAKDEKYLEWVARTAGIHLLAATSRDQLAVEIDTLGHGAFTYSLIEGLDGAADRTRGDDGIRATELLAYASEEVPELALRFADLPQIPTAFSYGADFSVSPPQ